MDSRERLKQKIQNKRLKEEEKENLKRYISNELAKPTFEEMDPGIQLGLKKQWSDARLEEIRKHLNNIKIIKRSTNDFNEIQSNIDAIKEIFDVIYKVSGNHFLNEVKTKRIKIAMDIFNKSNADKIDFHFYAPNGLNKIMEIIKLPDHKLQVKHFNLNLNETKITGKDSMFTIVTTNDDITEVQMPLVSHQFLEEIMMDNKMLFNIDKYIEFKLIDDLPKINFSFGGKRNDILNVNKDIFYLQNLNKVQ